MNAPHAAAASRTEEKLLQMQIRIARRADESAQQNGCGLSLDVRAWLQAEREILAPAQEVCEASDALLAKATTLVEATVAD
jgi:hypothetical protein